LSSPFQKGCCTVSGGYRGISLQGPFYQIKDCHHHPPPHPTPDHRFPFRARGRCEAPAQRAKSLLPRAPRPRSSP
ncbi:hypothetical protein IRJ41_003435, partial [Triplophysa rosa]